MYPSTHLLKSTTHLMILYALLIPLVIYKLRACRDAFGIRNRLLASTVLHLLALAMPIGTPHYRPWRKMERHFPPAWVPIALWGIAFLLDFAIPVIISLIQPITHDHDNDRDEHAECKKHHTKRTFELCFIVQVAEVECGAPCCSSNGASSDEVKAHFHG